MLFFKKLRRLARHQKLCEEWALANSCESVGPSTSSSGGSCSTASASTSTSASTSASASSSRSGPEDVDVVPETTFELKYLGSAPVESPSSEKETAEAIKAIVNMAKASGKKLQRVTLSVSLRGIRMTDLSSGEEQLQVSIYSISYCSADGAHDHVFGFIATNPNETMECHAYLCPKRKLAQTVTLTVAQAFNTAYELWQLAQLDSRMYHAQDKSPRLAGDADDENDEDDEEPEENDNDAEEERDKSRPDKRRSSAGEGSSGRASDLEKSASLKNLTIDVVAKENQSTSKTETWVSFENETADAEGIPLKPLKSPTTPSSASSLESVKTSAARTTASSWIESETTSPRKLDVACS